MKRTKVILILKIKDAAFLRQLRPVTTLPVLSKIDMILSSHLNLNFVKVIIALLYYCV